MALVWLLLGADMFDILTSQLGVGDFRAAGNQAVFMAIIAFMQFSVLVYFLARLGQLYRHRSHRPREMDELMGHYESDASSLAILVPSYKDYPDLAHSNDWLYINVDHGLWNAGLDANGNVIGQQVFNARKWFVRASLNDMASGAGQINLVYYEATGKNGLVKVHFAQSSPDAMYFAALPDSSTLSVFADPDAAGTVPTPTDIKISSYCGSSATNPCDYSVTAPDNLNWNVAPHGVLAAATVVPTVFCPPAGCTGPNPRHVYFGFDGGRNATAGRPFPYVRVAKVNVATSTLVSELDIWNPDFAFATPAFTTRPGSGNEQVALSLAVGGGGRYADNAVGFLVSVRRIPS